MRRGLRHSSTRSPARDGRERPSLDSGKSFVKLRVTAPCSPAPLEDFLLGGGERLGAWMRDFPRYRLLSYRTLSVAH